MFVRLPVRTALCLSECFGSVCNSVLFPSSKRFLLVRWFAFLFGSCGRLRIREVGRLKSPRRAYIIVALKIYVCAQRAVVFGGRLYTYQVSSYLSVCLSV